MADKGIRMVAPMVRALLREIERPGTGKTQTRRVINPQPFADGYYDGEIDCTYVPAQASNLSAFFRFGAAAVGGGAVRTETWAPRYAPGDRLYVREAHHRTNDSPNSHLVGYDFADGPVTRDDWHHLEGVGDVQFFRHSLGGWGGRTSRNYPAMHMPRWASRITLIVTDVRVQRVREISEADAKAEGMIEHPDRLFSEHPDPSEPSYGSAVTAFGVLWDSLNAHRGYGWDTNPWVAAYTFRPFLGNIDAIGGNR